MPSLTTFRKSIVRVSLLVAFVNLSITIAQAQQSVSIHFAAVVGDARLACGKSYEGIGTTKSIITPQDFRFYVHNVRLIDSEGKEVPVDLNQDGKWQFDNIALLDFEDGTGSCVNGNADMNDSVVGSVPSGKSFTGLRFTLGVPFERNHLDPLSQPSPLNLSSLMWVWNAGHKFARLDFSSTGNPRGYSVHLGSTGCRPNTTKTTIPTECSEPNRIEVELKNFDINRDVVMADLGALLKDTDVDAEKGGCMSSPTDKHCADIFQGFGLPFGGQAAVPQQFFRKGIYATSRRD